MGTLTQQNYQIIALGLYLISFFSNVLDEMTLLNVFVELRNGLSISVMPWKKNYPKEDALKKPLRITTTF